MCVFYLKEKHVFIHLFTSQANTFNNHRLNRNQLKLRDGETFWFDALLLFYSLWRDVVFIYYSPLFGSEIFCYSLFPLRSSHMTRTSDQTLNPLIKSASEAALSLSDGDQLREFFSSFLWLNHLLPSVSRGNQITTVNTVHLFAVILTSSCLAAGGISKEDAQTCLCQRGGVCGGGRWWKIWPTLVEAFKQFRCVGSHYSLVSTDYMYCLDAQL